jgi:hypothetical protein
MNPYLNAARDFSLAFRAQVQASDAQSQATEMAEQNQGYDADTRSSLPYGAPQPQQAGGVDESLNGFDADEDMRVDYMKNEMLQKAQQKAAQRGVQPV